MADDRTSFLAGLALRLSITFFKASIPELCSNRTIHKINELVLLHGVATMASGPYSTTALSVGASGQSG